MADPNTDTMLRETYRLARENNEMLRRMRRNAFLSGIVRVIFYFLILVVAPLWVYSNYLAPILQSLQQTVDQVQGTNQQAQSEFQNLQSTFQAVESKIPGLPTPAAK